MNYQSANVFLYKDGVAKLGDMNVSKVAKKGLLYTQTGTPYYARFKSLKYLNQFIKIFGQNIRILD